jgi:hypothetical protein
MYMNYLKIIFVILITLPLSVFAQKKNKKYNEGDSPRIVIYKIAGDSAQLLKQLSSQKNRIKVVLEGGMENIKHTVFVTSKNAIIEQDSVNKNEYSLIPQQESCEIIVDVKTFEIYYAIKETDNGNKKVKEIIKEYPPKTYMIGYEHYEVR